MSDQTSSNNYESLEIPIQQNRGLKVFDFNDTLILVFAPIEQVGQAYQQFRQVSIWQRDVYGHKIELTNMPSFITFQLRKHSWTVIQSSNFFPNRISLLEKTAQLISNWLQTKAIYFTISDTGGYIGYHLYNCGESLERLYDQVGDFVESEIEGHENIHEDEYRSAEGICQFRSQLCQIKACEIGNPYTFTDKFLQQQDAFIPGFTWRLGFKVGERFPIHSWLEHDDFERMDNIALYEAQPSST